MHDLQPWLQTVVWIGVGFGGVLALSSIMYLFLWIKYSLIRSSNSLNVTGGQVTQEIFRRNGVSAEIRPRWFYVKYWNHNKRRNTYALRPWTNDRKSIWTMMEATQQAYATTIRETNKKAFYLAFRLPNIIGIVGSIVGTILIALVIWKSDSLKDAYKYTGIGLGISVMVVTQSISCVWKASKIRKNAVPLIKDLGFQPDELKQIQFIYNFFYFLAIVRAIYETIKLIIKIAQKVNEKSN